MKDNCKYLAVLKYFGTNLGIVCNIRDECNDGQSLCEMNVMMDSPYVR